jgi:hypothetical protein
VSVAFVAMFFAKLNGQRLQQAEGNVYRLKIFGLDV